MKEKYNTLKNSKNLNKIEVNNIISKLGSIRNRNKGNAIILDSEKILTRKALIKAGYKRKNIHIPNNSTAFKKIHYQHNNTFLQNP